MFQTMTELIQLAKQHGSIAEAMIEVEKETSGHSREKIIDHMRQNLLVMQQSVEKGIEGVTSVTGLTGGDAKRLNDYIHSNQTLSGAPIILATRNAIAVNEVNAEMGLICANPTAGSAGVAAGVLTAIAEEKNLNELEQVNFLFVAGAVGLVIANNASISGAAGGCQAEVGSASAMASAALVELSGGTPEMCGEAVAMTLKNTMGLICDPVAGLVEVPCIKRNALGASLAFVSADMALAGIKSVIPVDEVIETMDRVGKQMPSIFKETAEGGLSQSATGQQIEKNYSQVTRLTNMTKEIDIKKNELRKQILEERSSLTLSEKKASDEAIKEHLQSQSIVSKAKSIFCYISTEEEIDTIQLINFWVQEGKEIVIPKVEKNRELTLHQLNDWSSLSYSSFNILEPTSNENQVKNIDVIDLIIVPCLGSDFTCHRLGYGNGFYDTFLSKSSAATIALCRDRFIYETIPYEIHDIQVDMILSETNVIHNEKKGVTLIE